jgi:hypothetical protein
MKSSLKALRSSILATSTDTEPTFKQATTYSTVTDLARLRG